MKFIDLFDWGNRPLCRRISIFICDFYVNGKSYLGE